MNEGGSNFRHVVESRTLVRAHYGKHAIQWRNCIVG